MNIAAVIELMDNVVSVEDVSTQNVGYDLEVTLSDGSKQYYEIKSVSQLGEAISISNNEYSTGIQYKEQYYLTIACQTSSEIKICFVQNPIENLSLSKRVTRWDWVCNEYSGTLVTTRME